MSFKSYKFCFDDYEYEIIMKFPLESPRFFSEPGMDLFNALAKITHSFSLLGSFVLNDEKEQKSLT